MRFGCVGVVTRHEFRRAPPEAVIADAAGARDVTVAKLDRRQLHVLLEAGVPVSARRRGGDDLLDDQLPLGFLRLSGRCNLLPRQPDHLTCFRRRRRIETEIANDPHDAIDLFDVCRELAARVIEIILKAHADMAAHQN